MFWFLWFFNLLMSFISYFCFFISYDKRMNIKTEWAWYILLSVLVSSLMNTVPFWCCEWGHSIYEIYVSCFKTWEFQVFSEYIFKECLHFYLLQTYTYNKCKNSLVELYVRYLHYWKNGNVCLFELVVAFTNLPRLDTSQHLKLIDKNV